MARTGWMNRRSSVATPIAARVVSRWFGRTDRQPGQPPVDRPGTRDGDDVEAQARERALPRCGHHRDTVRQPEAERHDGARRHAGMTVLSDRVRAVMEAHWQPE